MWPVPDPGEDVDGEPDRVGPKIVAGLAVASVGIRLGPEAALALGAASTLFESLAERAWGELRPEARQRAARVLSTAAEEIGCDDEQLGKLIGSSETSRLQTGLAMDAAQRTAWPPKVSALGRVLAEGLLATDEDQVNVQDQALVAMADLERLHLILLELLVKYEPRSVVEGAAAEPHLLPSYQDSFLGEAGPDNPKVWAVGRRKWTARQIVEARPQLRPVLTTLVGTLQRHGLAIENDSAPEVLEELSKDLVKQVNQQAGQMQRSQQAKPVILRETRIRSVQPSWSPTELGETILDYYRLAGEEEIMDALGREQPECLSHRSQVLVAVWLSGLACVPRKRRGGPGRGTLLTTAKAAEKKHGSSHVETAGAHPGHMTLRSVEN